MRVPANFYEATTNTHLGLDVFKTFPYMVTPYTVIYQLMKTFKETVLLVQLKLSYL